ncbi:hypothetical protein NM688_g7090 [Phlebia brevispora]|uniref:Uncharacterized protein n=1 Tax=Phlebia brevispora TaxID=194682 RepID=A0ACC1S990_9APHY|nr:hypothetical protein NM688_g7090 [Phlebia brevispora]
MRHALKSSAHAGVAAITFSYRISVVHKDDQNETRYAYEDATGDSDDDFSRAAKKQRLSSPTYDEQFELSQDEVAAFDAFERKLSQVSTPVPLSQLKHKIITDSARKRRNSAIALALAQTDAEFSSSQDDALRRPLFAPASQIGRSTEAASQPRPSGFTSAKHISSSSQPSSSQAQLSSSPPVVSTEQEMSDWFKSTSTDPPKNGLMFKSARDMENHKQEDEAFLDEWFKARAPTGAVAFQSAKSVSTNSVASTSKGPATGLPSFVSGSQLHSQAAGSKAAGKASANAPSLSQTETPSFVGFTSGTALVDPKAKQSSWAMPSAAAIAAAEAKMKQWEREMEADTTVGMELDHEDSLNSDGDQESPLKHRSESHQPSISLPSFGNALMALSATQNTASFAPASQHSEASASASARNELFDTPTPVARGFHAPGLKTGLQTNAKQFKSPLLSKVASTNSHAPSPLNSRSNFAPASTFVSPATPARKTTGFTTPLRTTSEPGPSTFTTPSSVGFGSALASSGFSTPISSKSLGTTPKRSTVVGGMRKSGFVTPFKPGFRPGEPGRVLLDTKARSTISPDKVMVASPSGKRDKGKGRETFFDLTKPPGRQTLESCGLRPQQYTIEELERKGMSVNPSSPRFRNSLDFIRNVEQLSQMTPDMAMYYTFHTASPNPLYGINRPGQPVFHHTSLGPKQALERLKELGCSLATKQWVDNHWGLILWKLSGMACLDPDTECDSARKRWCWREVMNQYRYRYEREINQGQRPVLRKIVAQDISPTVPMVLCVSKITWTEDNGVGEDGTPLPPVPELEVTDGWYRLSTDIDDPLERAVRKGKIKIGSKIAVVGCRVQCDRKDGGEILEMGKSVCLKIHGNSSQLAPWHTKLGMQKERPVSALGSLDPYGGFVSAIEILIVKAYPIAYLEFFVTEDGRRYQEGPWDEKEEAKLSDQWQAKRDTEAVKLREEYGTKLRQFSEYAEQLERKAAGAFHPSDSESPPDHVDDLILDLEDAEDGREIIRGVTPVEAGWLARAARDKCRRDEELMAEYIERDLNCVCPPRNVRSFRIVAARDARSEKRPATREVQITVWDVLSVQLEEDGKPGDFKMGQHLHVTNLWPCKSGCWIPSRDPQSRTPDPLSDMVIL